MLHDLANIMYLEVCDKTVMLNAKGKPGFRLGLLIDLSGALVIPRAPSAQPSKGHKSVSQSEYLKSIVV